MNLNKKKISKKYPVEIKKNKINFIEKLMFR